MDTKTYCGHCGTRQRTERNESGFLCCAYCGSVLQTSVFSEETTFIKNAAGQSQASGRNVYSISSEISNSRQRTLDNAYYFILQMAQNLGIEGGDSIAGPAKQLYTIALERNFTRGRRADQVAAACLYIICRENQLPFLLIEFAEYLGVNVYVLGAVFLQLCEVLSLTEHPIVKKPVDPSLFLGRFTIALFGEKSQLSKKVEKTAFSIITSMKRDWMQTGRKPSGLCGAALYISALAHGHMFTKNDIVKIVHICEATLTKRLIEFEDTASGSLTIEELDQNAKELERNLINSSKEACTFRDSDKVELLCQHKDKNVPHFAHGLCESCHEEFVMISGGLVGGAEPPAFQRAERERTAKIEKTPDANTGKRLESVDPGGVNTKDAASGANHNKEDGTDHASKEIEDDSGNPSDIEDAEVDDYLLNEEEQKYRKVIWEEMNREYLEEQAVKEAAVEAARKADMARTPEERACREFAMAAAEKAALLKKEQRRKRAAESKTPQTAAEATEQILKKKVRSSRFNYDALKEIFDEPVASNSKESTPNDTDGNWGSTVVDEEDYYNTDNVDYNTNNAPGDDDDYYNEEEVYNYNNDDNDDGSWF